MSEETQVVTQDQVQAPSQEAQVKKALCINNLEELVELIKGEKETIDTRFVKREICENPDMGYLQVIPYVTFYTTNFDEGKIKLVQYLRAAGINEDRLLSKTSVGFGGHIDCEEDLASEVFVPMEDKDNMYVMKKEELFASIFKAAKRELMEELSLDVKEVFGIDFNMNDTAFFMGNKEEEVNKVHIGLTIPVKLSEEQFEQFFKVVEVNKEEIDTIDKMNINLAGIIEDMDSSFVISKIQNELRHKHNMEDWSLRVLEFIIKKEINELMEPIQYHHLLELSKQLKDLSKIHNALVPEQETTAEQAS